MGGAEVAVTSGPRDSWVGALLQSLHCGPGDLAYVSA